MKLFLTGGTGSVGLELLRLILRERSFEEVRFLVRASSETELQLRWDRLLNLASDGRLRAGDCPGLMAVRGDITVPGLGLTERDAAWVRREATHVLHAAAAIDFNAAREDVRPINVDGTLNLLEVARRATKLEALAHISTLYVAGRRTGPIHEDDLVHGAGFVNAYEESKYEAELLVRAAFAELPIAVYRLSLLMGRAEDGYVHQLLEAHKMFELFLSGKARRVPGDPSHTLDMLPSDYAVRLLHDLFVHRFEASRTFHLSAGATAPTGADLIEACRRHLQRADWGVTWIGADEWAAIRAGGEAEGISPAALWMFEVVGDYMLLPKQFSRHNTDAQLAGCTGDPPRLVDYLPGILDRCAATNWGRS